MRGFECKSCGKTFFAVLPQFEYEDAKQIKAYKAKGFEFKEVKTGMGDWCDCRKIYG